MWPEDINLVQFLGSGRGTVITNMQITILMIKVRQHVERVRESIDKVHKSFGVSILRLRSALQIYRASTVIDDKFVLYANSISTLYLKNGPIFETV